MPKFVGTSNCSLTSTTLHFYSSLTLLVLEERLQPCENQIPGTKIRGKV